MNADKEKLAKQKLAKAEAKARKEAKKEFDKAKTKFKFESFDDIIDKSEKIKGKVKMNGPLSKLFDQIKLLISLVKDYRNGNYTEIPLNSMLAIGATLLYVLSPLDLIPDPIPVIGLVDDAAVVALCLKMVELDLENYEMWKNSQTA